MMRYQRNKAVQDIAKKTIGYLSSIIVPGITEREIKINDVELFTFEPHIRSTGGKYGFKMENIYYMNGNVLTEL